MITIAICDDDKAFLEILEAKIQRVANEIGLKNKIVAFNHLKELQGYDADKIDICFLDVMLAEGNSLDWLTENNLKDKPQIIAMTGFPGEIYNLSKTDACFLLLKNHLDDKTLVCALQKALQNITNKKNVILVSVGNKNHAICTDEIVYIESFNNNILLHLIDREINLYSTMKDFAKNLPVNFLKCHKSYVVNMNHITGFYRNFFTMKNGKAVPIPPKKYNSIIEEYSNYVKML